MTIQLAPIVLNIVRDGDPMTARQLIDTMSRQHDMHKELCETMVNLMLGDGRLVTGDDGTVGLPV